MCCCYLYAEIGGRLTSASTGRLTAVLASLPFRSGPVNRQSYSGVRRLVTAMQTVWFFRAIHLTTLLLLPALLIVLFLVILFIPKSGYQLQFIIASSFLGVGVFWLIRDKLAVVPCPWCRKPYFEHWHKHHYRNGLLHYLLRKSCAYCGRTYAHYFENRDRLDGNKG